MGKFRFAIQGGPFGDPVALAEHARLVESLGYDELYTSDHIGAPGANRKGGMFIVDPFAPLLIAAATTSRLRLGPLVLNSEFYNPALLARTAATVDRLTSGRLILGVGTGYSATEHISIGQPIRPPGPRVDRFGEFLPVLRELLDTGSVSHDGQHESIDIDDLGVEPVQAHIPFLIGGHGPRVVALAGLHADIFQFTGLTHGKDGAPGAGGFGVASLVERAEILSTAAQDRDANIERSALVQFVACGQSVPSSSELAEQFEIDATVASESPFILAGSVEQLVDKLEHLRDRLGISHYVVRDPEAFAPVVDALAGH